MSEARYPDLDLREQLARIDRAQAEIQRAQAETRKFTIEQQKLSVEHGKLFVEAKKLDRDRMLAPWLLVVSGMTAGAAFFGAGFALAKLFL